MLPCCGSGEGRRRERKGKKVKEGERGGGSERGVLKRQGGKRARVEKRRGRKGATSSNFREDRKVRPLCQGGPSQEGEGKTFPFFSPERGRSASKGRKSRRKGGRERGEGLIFRLWRRGLSSFYHFDQRKRSADRTEAEGGGQSRLALARR